jgi:very-short-patch-repair endonuclease
MTDADIDDFVRRYRSGETLKQLMAAFKIGHAKAVSCLAARDVAPNKAGSVPRKLTPEQAAELVSRYVAGESTKQLGPAFGLSSRSVSDYLRRAGVRARPRHHAVVAYMAGLTAEEEAALAAGSSRRMLSRWQDATSEERARMLDPMHEANRGSVRSEETRRAIVLAKERSACADSVYEQMLGDWLTERGVKFRRQVAVGTYVADLAIGNVLVEVTTGWARKKDWKPRIACFLDAGWHLYVAWHDNAGEGCGPFSPVVADDLIAWSEILQGDPSLRRQHRVIWRSREIFSTGSGDADYVADVFRASSPRGRWPLYDRAGHEA